MSTINGPVHSMQECFVGHKVKLNAFLIDHHGNSGLKFTKILFKNVQTHSVEM